MISILRAPNLRRLPGRVEKPLPGSNRAPGNSRFALREAGKGGFSFGPLQQINIFPLSQIIFILNLQNIFLISSLAETCSY